MPYCHHQATLKLPLWYFIVTKNHTYVPLLLGTFPKVEISMFDSQFTATVDGKWVDFAKWWI